jgi:hypothetical protein
MRDIIYFSYHEKSEKHFKEIHSMFAPLAENTRANGGTVNLWNRSMIEAGSVIKEEIKNARIRCKVAVLLVCSDYLNDTDCMEDLESFAKPARQKELILLWQAIRPCNCDVTELNDFKPLYKNDIASLTVAKRGERYLDIAKSINKAWEATFSHMVSNLATTSIEPESLDQLAERHNDFKPREVGSCLQKACEKLGTTLSDKYPDLHDMSWKNLKIYFSHGRARLDDSLFDLFSQELKLHKSEGQLNRQTAYVAFVIEDTGRKDRGLEYYKWTVCYRGPNDKRFEAVSEIELNNESRLIAFGDESSEADSLSNVLKALVYWVREKEAEVIFAIYTPWQLADVNWGKIQVVDEFNDNTDFQESCFYLLHPADRLESGFNTKRVHLKNKVQNLSKGSGKWLPEQELDDYGKINTSFSREDIVAIRCPKIPFNDRAAWLKSVVKSMVPFAAWDQAPTGAGFQRVTDQEFNQSLVEMDLIEENQDFASARFMCSDFESLARKRHQNGIYNVNLLVDDPERQELISSLMGKNSTLPPAISV